MNPTSKSKYLAYLWPVYLHEWLISMVHVGKYTIHGSYAYWNMFFTMKIVMNIPSLKQKMRVFLRKSFRLEDDDNLLFRLTSQISWLNGTLPPGPP